MKKRHRQAFGHYVRWIADEMGLRDWSFDIEFLNPESPANSKDHVWHATCEPIPGRKKATLQFAEWTMDRDREDLRETVVHELFHCHFFGIWDMTRRDLLGHLGQTAYDLYTAGFERHMEYGVDAAAQALAQHMPLIDWSNRGEE